MFTTIQRWGNSRAVKIPESVLAQVNLNENDRVKIKVQGGGLIIVPVKRHKTLKERIAGYTGNYQCHEYDTGKPLGKEVF